VDRVREFKSYLRVLLEGLVYVFETGRALDVLRDRETEAHCLAIFNVGVLAHYNHFQIFKGNMLEGIEDQILRWEDSLGRVFLLNELKGLLETWHLQVLTHGLLPIT
jgi:hypothetical protein